MLVSNIIKCGITDTLVSMIPKRQIIMNRTAKSIEHINTLFYNKYDQSVGANTIN